MNVNRCIGCAAFPCADVRHDCYRVPAIRLKPERVSVVLIAESASAEPGDDFYAGPQALYARTTVNIFNQAGAAVSSVRDIVDRGVYLTTAVKCAKRAAGLQTSTVQECSVLLEQELALFPNVKALLLMGDVAIKALNAIARRAGRPRVIPAQPTYKLRGQEFTYQGQRVFPSYLQAGGNYFIEKGKHQVMAADIAAALRLAG